jgi:hypothetical protein
MAQTLMGAGEAGEVILGPSSSQLYANVADAYRRAKVRLTEVFLAVFALAAMGGNHTMRGEC